MTIQVSKIPVDSETAAFVPPLYAAKTEFTSNPPERINVVIYGIFGLVIVTKRAFSSLQQFENKRGSNDEETKQVFGKRIIVTPIVVVALLCTISIVSGVPLYDSINISSSTIDQGQTWMVTGFAPGYENIQVWIFGPVEVLFFLQKIEPDGSYTISLLPEKTREMDTGNYHAILQFPHEPGLYDIRVKDWQVINTKKPATRQQVFSFMPAPRTPFSQIAYASLIQALNDPAVNDTYANVPFAITPAPVTEPDPEKVPILIHPVEDHTMGDQFVIDGTTTLPEGEEILVQIMPSSFVPGLKIPEGMQEGTTGTVYVMGNHKGDNTWRFPVDTTHWLAHEYLVSVAAIRGNATASTLFTLYSGSIRIDPVSNHTTGDTFTITGTIVLSDNDPLYVQLLYLPHILTKEITARQSSCGDTGVMPRQSTGHLAKILVICSQHQRVRSRYVSC